MGLGIIGVLLLVRTAYQLDGNSVLLPVSVSAQRIWIQAQTSAYPRASFPPAIRWAEGQLDSDRACVDTERRIEASATVSPPRYETKWQSEDDLLLLSASGVAALCIGFTMGSRGAKPIESRRRRVLPGFDSGRLQSTFEDVRERVSRGSVTVYVARHKLDGRDYFIRENEIRDDGECPWLQEVQKQAHDSADVLRYITCWIEQGRTAPGRVTLLTQFACREEALEQLL